MKYFFTIFFLFICIPLYAQNMTAHNNNYYDSLTNQILYIKGFSNKSEHRDLITDRKCGFNLINSTKLNLNNFPESNRNKLSSVLARPVNQTSVTSPNGFFRIHYDTSGINQLKYSLQDLLKAVDSAYKYEIEYLNFPPPPVDNSLGGDNRYDIYIQNIDPIYGYTEIENLIAPGKYTSFIVLDNDYSGTAFSTKGILAAMVTVAHEFHHAIQSGNYLYSTDETWFFEMTSTSMEELVFSDINDYIFYMKGLFNYPDKVFSDHSGYDMALWNIFLNKYFDKSIFKSQWEYFISNKALSAINKSLLDKSSNFKKEFAKFCNHNLYTGYRSEPTKYYSDGALYPLINFNMNIKFQNPKKEINGSSRAMASQYYLIVDSVNNIGNKNDTIYVIVINTNLDSALNWKVSSGFFPYKYTVANSKLNSNYTPLSKNLFYLFEIADQQNWDLKNILTDSTYQPPIDRNAENESPYPSPFLYSKNNFLNFYLKVDDPSKEYDLYFYSSDMKLIFDKKYKPTIDLDGSNKWIIKCDLKNDLANKLNSGIYFYLINNSDYSKKGKFVILND